MLEWCSTYAKMFGVVAAVIILGSWLVQNIALEQAKSLRDALAKAESEKMAMDTSLRLESRLLEVYQVASSARKYAYSARRYAQGDRERKDLDFKDEVYESVERLERVGVTRNFALLHYDYALRGQNLLEAFPASESTRKRMTEAIEGVRRNLDALEARGQRYLSTQREVVGDVIDPDTITPDQASQLETAIRDYRRDVETVLGPQLALSANKMFRATDEVLAAARSALESRKGRVRVLRRIQISLYIVGAVLALFGTFLQARPIRKATGVELRPVKPSETAVTKAESLQLGASQALASNPPSAEDRIADPPAAASPPESPVEDDDLDDQPVSASGTTA